MSFSQAESGIKSAMDFSNERSLNYLRGAAQALYDENKRLHERIAELEGRSAAADQQNAVLAELVGRQQQALFGRSSERRGGRSGAPPVKPPREPQKGHGRREQSEIETTTVTDTLPPSERACPCCGGDLEEMTGQIERTEIITVSDKAYIKEVHEQQKYRCRCNGAIVTAPGPKRLVPGGRYSPSFAIEVAIAKYADHLPLTRQAQIMKRDGLVVDSQTLWDQIEVLADYLQATYEAIIAEILEQPVIHADETRWPLMANGKSKENKLFQAWGLLSPELVAYRILDARDADAGQAVLGSYKGTVMADAYTVYQSLAAKGGFVVANCWAHVRRKFVECEATYPEETNMALGLMKQLYEVEREATDDNRPALRAERSRPVVDKLLDWARATRPKILPRSGLGEALGYLLNQEAGLRRYLDDGRVPIDNNACERALRGLVLGRKNHYGSRSRRGTEVAAIMYTITESAKLAGISPRAYLRALVDLAMQSPHAALTPARYLASIAPSPA